MSDEEGSESPGEGESPEEEKTSTEEKKDDGLSSNTAVPVRSACEQLLN